MFLANFKSNRIYQWRLKTSALLLLFLYFGGNVQLESFHQVFHSAEEGHSAREEEDPCHRAIYHDSQNEGCEHKTHVTAVKNCPLCHVVPFNEQHLCISSSFTSLSLTSYINEHLDGTATAFLSITPPLRGPPAACVA